MQKVINLEETPFIDLSRSRKKEDRLNLTDKYLPRDNIPSLEERIQFQIYPVIPYQEKVTQISNKNDRKKVNDIIKKYKQLFRLGMEIKDMSELNKMIGQCIPTILKYNEQGDPKCLFISYFSQIWFKQLKTSYKDLLKAEKTQYPLLMTWIGILKFQRFQSFKSQSQNWQTYYKSAILYGQESAFIYYGFCLSQLSLPQKAYQMYKNAYQRGYQPIACKYLGQLFICDNGGFFPRNIKVASQYFQQAIKLNAIIDTNTQKCINELVKQLQYENEKAELIKSTQDIQAIIVANFIKNKMQEYKREDKNLYHFGWTNNVCNSQSFGISQKRKQFYVVFSPLMNFTSRGFLVQDDNGTIQGIYIYNWQQIKPQKLKLLHKLGTKVILKEYIRKLGANDNMPMYRIQNPHSIQIHQGIKKHCICDKKLRNFASILFQKEIYDKCMSIYQYLIMKQADQLQIVYSNIGLIYQKTNKIQQSINSYKKSLSIKPFLKSQVRLCNIYIQQTKYKEAYQIAGEIQNQQEKNKILKQLQKLKSQSKQQQDFSKRNQIKRKTQPNQIIKFQMKSPLAFQTVNPTFKANIRQVKDYFLYHQDIFTSVIKLKYSNDNEFLDEFQKIYDSVQDKHLNKQSIQKFYMMAYIFYELENIRFYPHSLGYILHLYPLMQFGRARIGIQFAATLASRANYFQHHLQQMCLTLQQKQQYKQAQNLYRYTNDYCIPFTKKVAQMLYLQNKFSQCIDYCQEMIKFLLPFQITFVFQYLVEFLTLILKSHQKMKQYQIAKNKGQKYLKLFSQLNPKQQYAVYLYNASTFMFILYDQFRTINHQQNKNIRKCSSKGIMSKIYKQMALIYFYIQNFQKSEQFAQKNLKQKQKGSNLFYEAAFIKIKILKRNSIHDALKYVSIILKMLSNQKQILNKNIYTKHLMKQQLILLLQTENIQQTIDLCQKIIEISPVNQFFIKQKLFKFINKNFKHAITIIELLKQSKYLSDLWQQLFMKMTVYITDIQQKFNHQGISQEIYNYFKLKREFNEEQTQEKNQQNLQIGEDLYNYKKAIDDYEREARRLNQEYDINDQHAYLDQLQQNLREIQQQQQNQQIQGYINSFYDNGAKYIVVFSQKIKIEHIVRRKFITASDRICKRKNGSNGIKILEHNEIRLKISMNSRLTGKIQQKDDHTFYCIFDKFEGHDDYRRK